MLLRAQAKLRAEQQALARRLYPTGWQNVGDMTILEKDDDVVSGVDALRVWRVWPVHGMARRA